MDKNQPDQSNKTQILEPQNRLETNNEMNLELQQKRLAEWQQNLEQQAEALTKREQNIENSQWDLQQQQQQLSNKQKLLDDREKDLTGKLTALNERSLEVEARHQQQELRQGEIEQGLPELRDQYFAEREQQLTGQQAQLKQQLIDLASQKQELQEQRAVQARTQEVIDSDFAEQRAQLQQELHKARVEATNQLNSKLDANREHALRQLEQELQQRRDDLTQQQQQLEDDLVQLEVNKKNVQLEQAEVEQLESSLEQKLAERTKTRLQEFERLENQFEQEKNRLLQRIENQAALHGMYQELEKALGGRSGEEVLKELTAKNEELAKLRKDLERPSKELEEHYDNHRRQIADLEQANKQLLEQNRELFKSLDNQEQREFDADRLQRKHDSLVVERESILADNSKLQETLNRLRPAYNEPKNREERIKEIKRPYIEEFVPRRPAEVKELEWLESIRTGIDAHGLYFSHRILCAFHTALKISEWSPLTVLAGVSGTGKSELPKLYSRFGGINFINVPVQPNWDSQESMLGYFNSISNSYEAQPMLNFLVQSREKLVTGSESPDDNYNGLDDTVSLVLLDEMNLAHVELYFADFLSKLEQRRAAKNSELPYIDINLGSKLEPYKLSLGRNLLFAGTMNQDETTKSLSDKVIDRGTSIFFPRPNSLHRREKLKALPDQADKLRMTTWWKWINKESALSETVVNKYKKLIEDINECLGKDGRALGHRVWQSIEYYMVNHPLVVGLDESQYPDEYSEALKFAFEDQLVQKVMPKLRGIETRGYAKDNCLNPIRDILANNKLDILDDFDKAMLVGHGQFTWSSADYLNNEQNNERYQELFMLALNPSLAQSLKPSSTSSQKNKVESVSNRERALATESVAETPREKQQSSSFKAVKNMFKSHK